MSAADGKGAIAAAVGVLAVSATDPGAEQLSMLPPTRFPVSNSRHGKLVEAVKRDQAGRPPGARNKTTRETLDFIRQVIGDPALNRARWLRHTPETLAAELGCTKLEAFDRLDRINGELARLFYAPLAPVDGAGNSVPPFLQLIVGGAAQGVDAGKPWEYLDLTSCKPETQQNQAHPASPPVVSHGEKSHE